MIDLRSDTVTRPSPEMMRAMQAAEVGDDVLGDDPTVKRLEATMASAFGKAAAIFCPSGTMANQVAIKTHTRPGDQVICSKLAHIYHYEGGAIAQHSGASVCLVGDNRGQFTAAEIAANIRPDDPHFPQTRLVAVEDTCNKGGGSVWPMEQLQDVSALCRNHELALHCDGARLFNRLVATDTRRADWPTYAALFDSISVCLSKGLGAPVGSVLLGEDAFIHQARRYRKAMGGAMRQSGVLAAAGLYALEMNIDRLAVDHRHAKEIALVLAGAPWVASVKQVETNIVICETIPSIPAGAVVAALAEVDIHVLDLGPNAVRLVTHLDVLTDAVREVVQTLRTLMP